MYLAQETIKRHLYMKRALFFVATLIGVLGVALIAMAILGELGIDIAFP